MFPRLLLSWITRCLLCCFVKNHLNFAISCLQGRLLSASPNPNNNNSFNNNHSVFIRTRFSELQLPVLVPSTKLIHLFHMMNQLFSENKWFWKPSVYINECCNLMWDSVNKLKGSTQSKRAFIIRNAWIYLFAKVQGRWNLML